MGLGVMRFLQTEWHKHERDRNSWEIERAEMKARIAKLEGENRAAKRLQQGLMTRIRMLEIALKKKGEGEPGKAQAPEVNSVPVKCRLYSWMKVQRWERGGIDGWDGTLIELWMDSTAIWASDKRSCRIIGPA